MLDLGMTLPIKATEIHEQTNAARTGTVSHDSEQ
jgi:hypothetical protein